MRAFLRHLDGRRGLKYVVRVSAGSDRARYVVKVHRVAPGPPAAVESAPEAVYFVDRRTGDVERASAAPLARGVGALAEELRIAATGAAERKPAGGGIRLGDLPRPGRLLHRTSWVLGPGEALRFMAREGPTFGLGRIRVRPPGALHVRRRKLPNAPGRGGEGTARYEYTIRLAPGARRFAAVDVTTSGRSPGRSDPDWAFSFRISVDGTR